MAPILEEFVRASGGKVNAPFWQSICKVDGGSGGPYFNGWFTAFFPYLWDWKSGRALDLNPWAGAILERPQRSHADAKRSGLRVNRAEVPGQGETTLRIAVDDNVREPPAYSDGLMTASFPSGLARAPFRWHYLRQIFEMEFLAGFVGVRQDADTLALRPEIGWAVREAGAPDPGV